MNILSNNLFPIKDIATRGASGVGKENKNEWHAQDGVLDKDNTKEPTRDYKPPPAIGNKKPLVREDQKLPPIVEDENQPPAIVNKE